MIDIAHEQLVPLQQVPRLLPPRLSGKRVHVSAIYRWAQRGVRGNRLEVIRVGGTTYTSREALQRFAIPRGATIPLAVQTTGAREREIISAEVRLHRLLNRPQSRSGDKR